MLFDIAYTVSNEYTHCLAVSIASILKNSKEDESFNFYVLHADITDENKRKINKLKKIKDFNLEYIQMNNDDFKDMSEGISIVSNYRLKIASLKPKLSKILFLDADIIVLDSLKELYNTNLQDNYIAAVVDPGVNLQYEYTIDDKEKFPDRRFNTGVILANLNKWREDNVEEKIMAGMIWYSKKYFAWPDQNVMNMIFKNAIIELSPQYNVCPILAQQGWYQEEGVWEKASSNPKIVHICGMPKYWEQADLWWSDIFWEYAKLTPFYEDLVMSYAGYKDKILERLIISQIDFMNLILKYYSKNFIKLCLLRANYIRCKYLMKLYKDKNRREHYMNKRENIKKILKMFK